MTRGLRQNWQWVVVLALCACGGATSQPPPDAGAPTDAGLSREDAGGGEDDAGTADAGPQVLTATWEATTGLPQDLGRWGSVLTWDSTGHRFLMHGGNTGMATVMNDTWAFDVTTHAWTELPTTGAPPLRYCHCAAYLPPTHELLIVGGRDANVPLQTAWTLDLDTLEWTQVPGTVPTDGIGCNAEWVPALDKAVVFGGEGSNGLSNATWTYDAPTRTFTRLTVAGAPARRRDALPAFDPLDGRLYVFGGAVTIRREYLDDFGFFEGTRWYTFPSSSPHPSARRYGASGFDPVHHKWLLFGGTNDFDDDGDTWVFTPESLTFEEQQVTGAPLARGFMASGVDPETGTLYFFGGLTTSFDVRHDGWTLSLR